MNFAPCRLPLCLLILVLASGCATTVQLPPPGTEQGAADPWEHVLRDHVSDQGEIDFAAIKMDPGPLTEVVRRTASASPDAFSSPEQLLAFYINGYNALAMYLVVATDLEPEQKIRFFIRTRLPVAGQEMSLYHLENDVIRPLNEPRIHFALNCMVRDCPRLPAVPFRPATLDSQLQDAAVEFLNSRKHVRVVDRSQVVHLSRILKWYREDFETPDHDLIQYINQFRTHPIPETYTIRWLPYDWSLNQRGR